MASVLESVDDYINDVRVMLQDTISPYRYDDPSLLTAFNLALQRGAQLRPDLFIFKNMIKVPFYDAISGDDVPIEPEHRQAFVYGTASHALARDQEDIQDARANTFAAVFEDMLIGVRLRPVQGGTPSQQPKAK